MELVEHLGELRSRIIRSILYLVIGAVVLWQFFKPIYGFLFYPLQKEMFHQNVTQAQEFLRLHPGLTPPPPRFVIAFQNITSPFMTKLTMSVIAGFIFVVPLILWEIGAFIAPALTPQERKPLRLVLPISVFLMAFGVSLAYLTMYFAVPWFLSYMDDFPQPNMLMQNPNDYIMFMVKLMAAFAIAFQLPVVLMFGAFIGLITSQGLIKHWRWGVLVAALGGVFIPTNDLISMTVMVVSLLILYCGSIFLVKLVEYWKKRDKPQPT